MYHGRNSHCIGQHRIECVGKMDVSPIRRMNGDTGSGQVPPDTFPTEKETNNIPRVGRTLPLIESTFRPSGSKRFALMAHLHRTHLIICIVRDRRSAQTNSFASDEYSNRMISL